MCGFCGIFNYANSNFEITKELIIKIIEITDINFALNEKRKGLLELIDLAKQEKISDIAIAHPDRLAIFGFHYLEQLFSLKGINIHILNSQDKEAVKQELLADMFAIVSSFSGRLYGMRSRKRRIVESVKKEIAKEK